MVPEPSRLELYLSGQLTEAMLDSSGSFTMARERAVEKLAAFQLPRPATWILKLIQGLVAGGTDSIRISLRARETELRFQLAQPWSLEAVEDAFWDPEITDCVALDHLKRGLWNVAIKQQCPFQLNLAGWEQALIWTGQELRRLKIAAESHSTLTLSCQQSLQGARNSPQTNADLLREIQHYAFVCSVPLSVDGRRVDALQAGPHHGYGPTTVPFFLATASAFLEKLSVPLGTWEGYSPEVVAEGQPERLGRRKVGGRGPVSVAGVVALHRERDNDGDWQARSARSHMYWVKDGVVVHQEELDLEADVSISCGVFASAQGMATDLTGFSFMDGAEVAERRRKACASIKPIWSCTEWSLDYLNMKGAKQAAFVRFGKNLLRWLVLRLPSLWQTQSGPEQLYDVHKCDLATLRKNWRQLCQRR